jgi:hypothetical protein
MMIRRTVSSLICAAALVCAAVPYAASAEDTTVHTVTVLDYNGNVMTKLAVGDGQAAPLDSVDKSSLEYYEGIYTQVGFSSWSCDTSNVRSDMTVQALYKKMTISLEKLPSKTEYYSPAGNVDLSGLAVYITINTQLPETDGNGNFKVSQEIVDIASKCTAEPSYLSDAFANGDSAKINIYPINSDKAIGSYTISYYKDLGDADKDGMISSMDASYILKAYADASVGGEGITDPSHIKRCDVDLDGSVTSSDASLVLRYYAYASTVDVPRWEDIQKNK